jgi:hypothetical protein
LPTSFPQAIKSLPRWRLSALYWHNHLFIKPVVLNNPNRGRVFGLPSGNTPKEIRDGYDKEVRLNAKDRE